MPTPLDFLVTILSTAGVAAALLAAAAWLLRAWISERLSAQVRYQYDRKLAELDRLGDRLRISAQSLGEVQKATIERRLLAVEEVWIATLDAERTIPAVFTTFDVLLDSEYPSALNNARILPDIQALDHYQIIGPALTRGQEVAKRRPFVGTFLWAVFSTYRAVLFRMIYLVSQSPQKPEKINWYRDDLIRKHIRAGLGDKALAEFDSLNISRVIWVREHFSRAILGAMELVIAGTESSDSALRQAERMEELLVGAKASK